MFSILTRTTSAIAITGLCLTGCATKTLINKDNKTYTRTERVTLVEDNVVAFGRPAQMSSNLPKDSIVIAGQKNSYILTQGGSQFVGLISKLDAIKLKEDLSKKDLEFFIENGAKECSSSSDERMQAQRFCFDIKLAGVVYPAANNLTSLKALSKPYQVTIYTNKEESYKSKSGMNPLEKLVLLPFAVAIDVVSLPFQAAEKIFD